MKGQTRGNNLERRGAGRLAGALGLLLALALIASGATPVHADGPPLIAHYFDGTVTKNGVPVAPGTVVEAFVGADTEARVWTSLFEYEDESWYTLSVPGTTVDVGQEVRFKVGGVEANPKATWTEAGTSFNFDLTIPDDTPPPVQYDLTIQSTAGGSVTTPGEGVFSRAAGIAVNLVAEADEGYRFKEWTATAGSFDNRNAATTTFAMPSADATITANFEVKPEEYTLTMAASPPFGGTVSPGANDYLVEEGTTVNINAFPGQGYLFAGWTASPAVTFGNPNSAATNFVMPSSNVAVTATFTQIPADPFGCFIATAAYGTESAVQIDILREFRDTVLLPNRLGAGFVSLYYRASPPIAGIISGHEFLRTLVRVGLVDPIVALVDRTHGVWAGGS